jgi:hypothetical protein
LKGSAKTNLIQQLSEAGTSLPRITVWLAPIGPDKFPAPGKNWRKQPDFFHPQLIVIASKIVAQRYKVNCEFLAF